MGFVVVGLGIPGAGLFYWIEVRAAAPMIDELLPDYSRERTRDIGIMMGTLGVLMLGWTDALQRPGTQAIIIAAASALVALVCFRLAWVLDYNEQARQRPGGHD